MTPPAAPADDVDVARVWRAYVAATGYAGPLAGHFSFGDTAVMADELADLVLHGPKRATAGLRAGYDADGEPLPQVGDRSVVTRGDGRAACVLATTEVRVGPLSSVDDDFAWDEGEGDRSRAWWLAAHTRFLTAACATLGLRFTPDVEVVFERFDLVWPTAPASDGGALP